MSLAMYILSVCDFCVDVFHSTLQPWEPPTSPWPKTRSDTVGRISERRTDLLSSDASLHTLEIRTHGKLSRQHACVPIFVLKEHSLKGDHHFKSTQCVSVRVLACMCVFVNHSDGATLLFRHYWHICEVLKYPLSNNLFYLYVYTVFFHQIDCWSSLLPFQLQKLFDVGNKNYFGPTLY